MLVPLVALLGLLMLAVANLGGRVTPAAPGVAPQVGDVGLVITGGWGARLIRLGDRLKCWRRKLPASQFNHVVVYLGAGLIIEAQPGGAVISPASRYRRVSWRTWHIPLTSAQRTVLRGNAVSFQGRGYNWIDIAALTLAELGWNVQRDDGRRTWVGRRIASMRDVICSELAVLAYQMTGLLMFPGLLAGEATPGDLDRCALLVPVT